MNSEKIKKAKEVAKYLYEGKDIKHRSCGVALAETFCLPTRPYASLRKGGVTGENECGAILAGRLVLGELLGDPDPLAPITPKLFDGMHLYKELCQKHLNTGAAKSYACYDLTQRFKDFDSQERKNFCGSTVETVAGCVTEVLERLEVVYKLLNIAL
ncbi:MAG: hypothetical protein ABII18_10270 [bacterium]|nr:hypothetical protein [bacterium]MBU1918107.1 hypothetical protein [bacterium]